MRCRLFHLLELSDRSVFIVVLVLSGCVTCASKVPSFVYLSCYLSYVRRPLHDFVSGKCYVTGLMLPMLKVGR